jgi:exosortase/archaeosortase family protein
MKQTYLALKFRYDQFFRERNMEGMKDIIAFVIITLLIHAGWRFWEINLQLFPVYGIMSEMMDGLAHISQKQTEWLWNNVMHYGVTSEDKIVFFTSGYDISVGRSCSGMKQIMQFVILIAVYRGPWLKKLWFIPMGAILVHCTNVLRIFMTGVFSMNYPSAMQFMHDNVLRWMFYLVICGLWMYWVKRVAPVSK